MSGARPSAGRPVLAFPCVPAPGVGAASQIGESSGAQGPASASLAVPRSPRRSPGGIKSRGAWGGSPGQPRGLQRPQRRRGRRRWGPGAPEAGRDRDGQGGGGGGAGQAQTSGSAPGLAPTESRAPGAAVKLKGHRSSPPQSLEPGGSSPSSPFPRPGWKNPLFPPRRRA